MLLEKEALSSDEINDIINGNLKKKKSKKKAESNKQKKSK
jgi:hypothetical protein